MRVCTRCNTPYPDTASTCERDGAPLTTISNLLEEKRPLPQEDHCGQIVGNYKLVTRLGLGGMGAVYQGTHVAIGKEAAIKILREDQARDEALLERFLREARSVAKIGHENVVQILDFGCTPEGRAYLVMELLSGRSLEDLLEQEGALPLPRAFKIAIQICSGLEAAHAQNIIHRDLKPDNVFLIALKNDPEFVKILDFGIAKEVSEAPTKGQAPKRGLTLSRQLIGTPLYMAPEQGSPDADARIDIYALGVILYRMVTGQLPFDGENPMDILYKHLTQEATPPIQLRPEISPALNEVILRCLAKNREERMPSAAVLSERLIEIGGFLPAFSPSGTFIGAAPQPSKLSRTNTPKSQTTLNSSVGEIASTPKSGARWPLYTVGLGIFAAAFAGVFFLFPEKPQSTAAKAPELTTPSLPEKAAPSEAPASNTAPVIQEAPATQQAIESSPPKEKNPTKKAPAVVTPEPPKETTPKRALEDANPSLDGEKKKKKKSLIDADPTLE